MGKALVAPSILAADFANLERDVRAVMSTGADWVHVDVMDGHFVPNLTIGPVVVKSLRKIESSFLDVHLMIDSPEKWVDDYLEAGADLVTAHIEALTDFGAFIKPVREAGKKVGISLRPGTDVSLVEPHLKAVDLVLVMTVEPGFGGQSFMENQLEKIAYLDSYRKQHGLNYLIEVDGGITDKTARLCKEAGADVFVAGSYIFKGDFADRIASLKI